MSNEQNINNIFLENKQQLMRGENGELFIVVFDED